MAFPPPPPPLYRLYGPSAVSSTDIIHTPPPPPPHPSDTVLSPHLTVADRSGVSSSLPTDGDVNYSLELRRLLRGSASSYLGVLDSLTQANAAVTPEQQRYRDEIIRRAEAVAQGTAPAADRCFPPLPAGTILTPGQEHMRQLWLNQSNIALALARLRAHQARHTVLHALARQLERTKARTAHLQRYARGAGVLSSGEGVACSVPRRPRFT